MAQLCVEIWEDESSSSKQEGDTLSQNSPLPFNDPKKPKTILTWTVNTSPIVHSVQKWCRYLRVSVFGTSQQSFRISIPSCVSGMRHYISILSPTSGSISVFRWESLERSEKQRVLAEAQFRAHQQLLVQKLIEFHSGGSTLDFPREGRMREELRGLSDLREQVDRSQIYFNGIWRKSRKLRSLLYETLRESTLDEETAALRVIQEDINKDGTELRDATSISRWLTCCESLSDFIQKLFAAVPSPVNELFLPDSTTKIARPKIDSLFETFCLQQGPTKKLKKFIGDLIVLVGPLCGDTWDNFCSEILQQHFDTPTPGISQKVNQEGFSILQAILNSDSRYKEQVFHIFELLKLTTTSPSTKAGLPSNSTTLVRLNRRQLSLIGWIFSLLLGLFVKKEAVTALPAFPQDLNPVKMVFDILNNLLVFSAQPALFVIASDVLIHLFGYYSLHIEEGFVNHPAFTDFFVSVLRSNNSILRNCLLRILESLTFSIHTQIRTTALSKIVTLLLQPNLLLNSRSTARKSNKPPGLSAEVLEILSIINSSSIDSQEHVDFLLSNLSGSSPKAWNLALRLLSSVNSLSLVNSDQLLAAAFRSMLLLPSTESSLVGPDILSFLSQLVFDESPVVSVTCQNLLVKEILLVSQQYIIPQLEQPNQGQRYSNINISFVMPLLGTVARALKKDQKVSLYPSTSLSLQINHSPF
jgi:hypothetical protein